jgi:hypothetical protein
MQQADALHDAWLKAVADNHAKYVAEIAPAVGAIKSLVDAQYGPTSTEFTAFGFTARKKPVLSAKAKAAAVDQSLATRSARHTMGPKQKLGIRGVAAPKAEGAHASAEPNQPAVAPSVTTQHGTSH